MPIAFLFLDEALSTIINLDKYFYVLIFANFYHNSFGLFFLCHGELYIRNNNDNFAIPADHWVEIKREQKAEEIHWPC